MNVKTVFYTDIISLLDECDRFEFYLLSEDHLKMLIKRTSDTSGGSLHFGREMVKDHFNFLKKLYSLRDEEKGRDSKPNTFGKSTGVISIYTMLRFIRRLAPYYVLGMSEDFIDDLASLVKTCRDGSERRWFKTSISHFKKLYADRNRHSLPALQNQADEIKRDISKVDLKIEYLLQQVLARGNDLFTEPAELAAKKKIENKPVFSV